MRSWPLSIGHLVQSLTACEDLILVNHKLEFRFLLSQEEGSLLEVLQALSVVESHDSSYCTCTLVCIVIIAAEALNVSHLFSLLDQCNSMKLPLTSFIFLFR